MAAGSQAPRAVLTVKDGAKDRPVSLVSILPASPSEDARSFIQECAHAHASYRSALVVTDYIRGWKSVGTRVAQLTLADATRENEWHRFAKYLCHGLDGTSAPKAAVLHTQSSVQPPSGPASVPATHGNGASVTARFVIAPPATLPAAGTVVLDIVDTHTHTHAPGAVSAPVAAAMPAPASMVMSGDPPREPSLKAAVDPAKPSVFADAPLWKGAHTHTQTHAHARAHGDTASVLSAVAISGSVALAHAPSSSVSSAPPAAPFAPRTPPHAHMHTGAGISVDHRASGEMSGRAASPTWPEGMAVPAAMAAAAARRRPPAGSHIRSEMAHQHGVTDDVHPTVGESSSVTGGGPIAIATASAGLKRSREEPRDAVASEPSAADATGQRHLEEKAKEKRKRKKARDLKPPTEPNAPAAALDEPFVGVHGHVYASAGQLPDVESSTKDSLVVESMVQRIVEQSVPFPYKRFCITRAALLDWFTSLQRHRGPSVRFAPYKLHGYLDAGRLATCNIDAPLTFAPGAGDQGAVLQCSAVRLGLSLPPSSLQVWQGTSQVFLPFDDQFNEAASNLIDYFTEDARMAAVRKGESGAPADVWHERATATNIVLKALRKYGELTDFSLRHGMYGIVHACNLFKPNLARSLYTLLGGTRVLDMCAGWGCRLVGALSCPGLQRYLACDPNPALRPGHTAMMSMFSSLTSARCEVLPERFEDAVIPDDDVKAGFDLALTSPPYFDLEVYQHRAAAGSHSPPQQSIDTFPELHAWLQQWYFPMMDKAWSVLQSGGHLALYINDHAKDGEQTLDICHPMLQHAATMPDCRWVGILGVEGETGSVRPLWVWRKGALPRDRLPPPLYIQAAQQAGVLSAEDSLRLNGAVPRLDSHAIGVAPPTTSAEDMPPASQASLRRPIGLDLLMRGKIRPAATA